MQGLRTCLASAALIGALAGDPLAGRAEDLVVNGYTYIAPSVYLTPPIVYYDPAFVIPAPYVVRPLNAPGPMPPVVYGGPVYVAPVATYNPAWQTGYAGPSAIRERAYYSRNGLEYKYQEYVPGRAAPAYTYRIDSQRHGVRVRERYR